MRNMIQSRFSHTGLLCKRKSLFSLFVTVAHRLSLHSDSSLLYLLWPEWVCVNPVHSYANYPSLSTETAFRNTVTLQPQYSTCIMVTGRAVSSMVMSERNIEIPAILKERVVELLSRAAFKHHTQPSLLSH